MTIKNLPEVEVRMRVMIDEIVPAWSDYVWHPAVTIGKDRPEVNGEPVKTSDKLIRTGRACSVCGARGNTPITGTGTGAAAYITCVCKHCSGLGIEPWEPRCLEDNEIKGAEQ